MYIEVLVCIVINYYYFVYNDRIYIEVIVISSKIMLIKVIVVMVYVMEIKENGKVIEIFLSKKKKEVNFEWIMWLFFKL